MSDVIVHHIGGGGGLSKCSIIVHVETGSTVGAYSDSAATTLVKLGKEIGTSGDYVITGLNTGTYYVKAEKGSQSAKSSAITFSAYGVNEVTLAYGLFIIKDSVLVSGNSFNAIGSGTTTFSGTNVSMTSAAGFYISPKVARGSYTKLKIEYTYTSDSSDWTVFGLSSDTTWYDDGATTGMVAYASLDKPKSSYTTKSISLTGISSSTTYYVKMYTWGDGDKLYIKNLWFE